MSNFCVACGQEIPDGGWVCPNCQREASQKPEGEKVVCDLIRRSDALRSIQKVVVSPRGGYLTKAKISAAIENNAVTPTVEAVPLRALCKYLAEYAAPPIRSPMAMFGSLEKAWEYFFTKTDWQSSVKKAGSK